MKTNYFLLCFVVLISGSIQAQQQTLIDNNWHIDFITIDNETTQTPIVNPIGIVNTNINFGDTNMDAVMDPDSDSFFGDISYDDSNNEFTISNFGITLPGCQAFCGFANNYFAFLSGNFANDSTLFSYEVTDDGNGTLGLIITDENGNIAVYQDQPILSTSDFTFTNVTIHPNPAQDFVTISTDAQITSVSVYDITGKKVQTTLTNKQVDIASLPIGMYLLTIYTDQGNSVQKIIKK